MMEQQMEHMMERRTVLWKVYKMERQSEHMSGEMKDSRSVQMMEHRWESSMVHKLVCDLVTH